MTCCSNRWSSSGYWEKAEVYIVWWEDDS